MSIFRILDVVRAIDLSRSQDAFGGPRELRADNKGAEGGAACNDRLPSGRLDDSRTLVWHVRVSCSVGIGFHR